jgi:carbonic anhydrase/acetyltransferase-like protein (isoleucine patch superfamily)
MPSQPFAGLTPSWHATAWVHPSAQLLGDVVLGEDVSVWPTTVLRGDCGRIDIGARTNLQDGTIAHATFGISTTTVGADCTIGHRVLLHGCIVGKRCLIGMGSILLDGVEIGDNSFVAAGSLVTPGKVFAPGSFIMGSPAKRVRDVNDTDRAIIAESVNAYLTLMRAYR